MNANNKFNKTYLFIILYDNYIQLFIDKILFTN